MPAPAGNLLRRGTIKSNAKKYNKKSYKKMSDIILFKSQREEIAPPSGRAYTYIYTSIVATY